MPRSSSSSAPARMPGRASTSEWSLRILASAGMSFVACYAVGALCLKHVGTGGTREGAMIGQTLGTALFPVLVLTTFGVRRGRIATVVLAGIALALLVASLL